MSIENYDILIIGGGVIGLTIARALRQRGVQDVVVIDKNEFGREASWAAGGILAPQVEADGSDDFFGLACASRDMYRDFAKALKAESGIDIELDTKGTLYVAFTEAEEKEFRLRYEWQVGEGLEIEWLDGDAARALEASLSENVRCALRFPNDFQVENRRLVEALLVSNQKSGVRLIDYCPASEVRVTNGKICGVETSQGFISVSTIVIAAGAWSSMLDPSKAIQVGPVRGQMLCFQAQPQIISHVIYSSRGYLIPRRDGRLLAGSTSEHAGFDKRVTEAGIGSIKSMACEIVPLIDKLPLVDSWSGFRPHAADDLPVLGFSTETEGLVYATGHFRNGILLAPITGELISELIVSGKTPAILGPFQPDRFQLTGVMSAPSA